MKKLFQLSECPTCREVIRNQEPHTCIARPDIPDKPLPEVMADLDIEQLREKLALETARLKDAGEVAVRAEKECERLREDRRLEHLNIQVLQKRVAEMEAWRQTKTDDTANDLRLAREENQRLREWNRGLLDRAEAAEKRIAELEAALRELQQWADVPPDSAIGAGAHSASFPPLVPSARKLMMRIVDDALAGKAAQETKESDVSAATNTWALLLDPNALQSQPDATGMPPVTCGAMLNTQGDVCVLLGGHDGGHRTAWQMKKPVPDVKPPTNQVLKPTAISSSVWRTGTKVPCNLYKNDEIAGQMQSDELAAEVVVLCNGRFFRCDYCGVWPVRVDEDRCCVTCGCDADEVDLSKPAPDVEP